MIFAHSILEVFVHSILDSSSFVHKYMSETPCMLVELYEYMAAMLCLGNNCVSTEGIDQSALIADLESFGLETIDHFHSICSSSLLKTAYRRFEPWNSYATDSFFLHQKYDSVSVYFYSKSVSFSI